MNSPDDVIAAIATPIGEGGIAIIRVSGKQAVQIVDDSFRGKYLLKDVSSHTAHFGYIVDEHDKKIDEVVGTIFLSPHSYTGENTVEVGCHGGIYVSQRILERFLMSGARHAEPGEFTKRAYLNGKMDLSQAEAVADIIHAKSEYARKLSLDQLDGRLSHTVAKLKDRLMQICSILELELDFVEEGLMIDSKQKILTDLNLLQNEIKQMINSYKQGRVYCEGFKVCLVGEPNVGKSSIFNYLIDKNRSIVTSVAGTTRDFIEENILINGMLFRLIDTAGLRVSDNIVETEGIKRTLKEIDTCDLILFIKDLTKDFYKKEIELVEGRNLIDDSKNVINVLNKFDLFEFDHTKIISDYYEYSDYSEIFVSAKTGYGIELLKQAIFNKSTVNSGMENSQSVIVTNLRHKASLEESYSFIYRANNGIKENISNEFIVADLRASMNSLGAIVGNITSEDILNNIFSNFCIGK